MRSTKTAARWLVRAAWLACVGGCAGSSALRPALPEVPSEQAKCRVGANQNNPLVTEWPASEKANLESLLRDGAAAVSYSGCTLRVLPRCRLQGRYLWQRTTPASDVLEINGEDELYAKLPLGAASLEGELKRAGKLSVKTTVSGQLRLENATAVRVPDEGVCARATHLVGAISVGTFTLSRGASVGAGVGAGISALGTTGGRLRRSANDLRSAGDPSACSESDDGAPHPNCRSPIQVFLWPIPGRVAEEGPPGTVKTEFVSASMVNRWDVYIDDEVACTTPCAKWVDPSRPITLRTRGGSFFRRADKVQTMDLGPHASSSGAIQYRAHPTAYGKLATGITFTALGGIAAVAGIALTAVGCAGDSGGMCRGGLISLGTGALVAAGAIWLMLDALPRAEIRPKMAAVGPREDGPTFAFGPGFVVGVF